MADKADKRGNVLLFGYAGMCLHVRPNAPPPVASRYIQTPETEKLHVLELQLKARACLPPKSKLQNQASIACLNRRRTKCLRRVEGR